MATNINKICISGNLTNDAEYKATPSGHHLISFSLANNRKIGQQDYVNYIGVTKFGTDKIANIASYLKKGTGVVVIGELRQERWQDQNGQNKTTYRIYADDIEFKGKSNGGGASQPKQPVQPGQVQYGGYYQQQQQSQQQAGQQVVRPSYTDNAVDNTLNQMSENYPDWVQ